MYHSTTTTRAIDGSAPIRLGCAGVGTNAPMMRFGLPFTLIHDICGIEQVFVDPAGKPKQQQQKHTSHVVGGGKRCALKQNKTTEHIVNECPIVLTEYSYELYSVSGLQSPVYSLRPVLLSLCWRGSSPTQPTTKMMKKKQKNPHQVQGLLPRITDLHLTV